MKTRFCLAIAVSGPLLLLGTLAADGLTYPERPRWPVAAGYSTAVGLMILAMLLMLWAMSSNRRHSGSASADLTESPGVLALIIGFAVLPTLYFAKKLSRQQASVVLHSVSPGRWAVRGVGLLVLLAAATTHMAGVESVLGVPTPLWGLAGVFMWLVASWL